MRSQLGVLLMEDRNGEVTVQLFAEVSSASRAYDNLMGQPEDPDRRATFIGLNFAGEKVDAQIVKTKMLPIIESVEDRPDGFVLGKGPVKFEKPKED